MERIEALIKKLNDQLAQNAGPEQMSGTVQLLQFELNKQAAPGRPRLGTSKVAVVLPAPLSASINDLYERNASIAETPVQSSKETVLVENGAVSVVQKNGQLDMVFDPMLEIPTLSQQISKTEVKPVSETDESLNDKLKQNKTELLEVLKETPVKDLRKAIGINDRYIFINELFHGDENMYERCIKTINSFGIYAEAQFWISRELKTKEGWSDESETVQHFDQLVRRRFS